VIADRRRDATARLMRADGDGWTLTGRADGPVLILANALPACR
jgi:hypothetical protein